MDDLNKALGDISNIRRQVARATEFRGYGPATLAATGALAILAACSKHSGFLALLHMSTLTLPFGSLPR